MMIVTRNEPVQSLHRNETSHSFLPETRISSAMGSVAFPTLQAASLVNARDNASLAGAFVDSSAGGARSAQIPALDAMMQQQLNMAAFNGGINDEDLNLVMALNRSDGIGWTRAEQQTLLHAVRYLPWADQQVRQRAQHIVQTLPVVDVPTI